MIEAMALLIFLVNISLSAFMLPVGSVLIKILLLINLKNEFPILTRFYPNVNFISSLLVGLLTIKPCPKRTTVKPIFSGFM